MNNNQYNSSKEDDTKPQDTPQYKSKSDNKPGIDDKQDISAKDDNGKVQKRM